MAREGPTAPSAPYRRAPATELLRQAALAPCERLSASACPGPFDRLAIRLDALEPLFKASQHASDALGVLNGDILRFAGILGQIEELGRFGILPPEARHRQCVSHGRGILLVLQIRLDESGGPRAVLRRLAEFVPEESRTLDQRADELPIPFPDGRVRANIGSIEIPLPIAPRLLGQGSPGENRGQIVSVQRRAGRSRHASERE